MPIQETLNNPQYIALHTHSEYSLLDGASRIEDLCKRAKELGMPGLALTEHGTMFSAYKFYTEAKDNDLKPIIGCEIYVINQDHTLKGKENKCKLFHLVLLAKNDKGYQNLIKITSESCIHGFYYKPRVSKDFLKNYSSDLIALSACLGGEVNHLLCIGQDEEARMRAIEYKELFGEDFYLEIMDHKYLEDKIVNPKMLKLSKELGIKLVATNDSHYTYADEARSHDALLCLQTGVNVSDIKRMKFSSLEHFRSQEEMLEVFATYLPQEVIEQAVLHTPMEIYNKISDYELLGNPKTHLPDPKVPEGHSFETYLKEVTYEFARKRFPEITDEIKNRLELELEVMNDSGFASYFLVVWDFIKWAREQNIPVGPGRGSAAGSLVAYCLGITNIDPLKYDLLFERFLNPERKSMPDIDTDFCIDRREEVINYVKEKYGHDSVCQIITFNRLTSRAVLKDMARVLEYPYSKAEELAKLIPVVRGKPRSIEWMLENHEEFARKCKNDPEAKEVIDLALKNEGVTKTFGVHAAGVIIADQPVDTIIPISKSNDGSVITQFSMDECAYMGLLKMDFLGLRNLTMIQKAIDIIEAHGKPRIDIDAISMEDPQTFESICSGNLAGIFQLETSGGMKQIAKDLAPRSLEDISALIALYRPGPLDTGMIDEFIACKNGKKKITYEHPLLEQILQNTYGTIVYQEQIMQIAQKLGGFSLGEADLLRRAMGKKKPEVLMPYKDRFVEGCKNNAIPVPVELADKLFEQMIAFAEYCFNKSHSTAYGFVTYQTAYLKTHYPVEYMCSLFISSNGDIDRIKTYIIESQRLGIEIVPPHVNISEQDFCCVFDDNKKGSIVFGLRAVKGVGDGACQMLIEERNKNGKYKDFYDLCLRADAKTLNKKTLESLIKCGALDGLGAARKAMFDHIEVFVNSVKKEQQAMAIGQSTLFAAAGLDSSVSKAPLFINGPHDEYLERDLQAMEYELLGLFVSKHPMESIMPLTNLLSCITIQELENKADKANVTVAALITAFEKKLTKTNKQMCILKLEDMESKVEGVMFSKQFIEHEALVVKGKRVLAKGTLAKHSEGNMSIMVDSLEDLDDLGTVEFELDIDSLADYFQFIHSFRTYIARQEFKGNKIIVLKLTSNNESKKIALGNKFTINDNAETLTAIRAFLSMQREPANLLAI